MEKQEIKSSESLATKYRPIKLKDMIGQNDIKMQIKGMLTSGILPKAVLITGQTGCGKTTLARIIARHINKITDITEYNDVLEVNIGTDGTADAIRALVEKVKFLPRISTHKKIFILDEVHRLTKASASGLLKVIEEPPEHAMFLLCTNEPSGLLDTLKNRCERIELKPYKEEDIIQLLNKVCEEEKLPLNEEQKKLIAIKCNLQPRDCLAVLQGVLNLIKGGNKNIDNLVEIIEKNFTGELFTVSNYFLKALYAKNIVAGTKAIDTCPDVTGMLNIIIASNRNLIKYMVSKVDTKYKPEIPYGVYKSYEDIKRFFNEDLNKGLIRAIKIHKILLQCKSDSMRVGFDMFDSLLSLIGNWCLEE